MYIQSMFKVLKELNGNNVVRIFSINDCSTNKVIFFKN